MKSILTGLLLWLAAVFVALGFAMPWFIAVPFALLCAWMTVRKKQADFAAMMCSLLLLLGGVEWLVRANADTIFYREHERYALKTRYRTGIDQSVHVRFGDLVAMAPPLQQQIAEPHTMQFSTDSRGYRNTGEYAGEPYIILGDSFATSVNSSQPDILVSQLNARLPQHFYSLAFPGAPNDYEASAFRFLRATKADARFLWFVFEGNDFYAAREGSEKPHAHSEGIVWKDYININALPLLTPRVIQLLRKTAKSYWNVRDTEPAPVGLSTVAGSHIGFLHHYAEKSLAQALEVRIFGDKEVMQRSACVFFIPDKYRVYKPWIKDGRYMPEPAAGLVALQQYFGSKNIPVVDLTPALRRRAETLLAEKKFVFWRDDTHWSPEGIKSILDDVINCVEADKKKAL
jgi:hypothetical protein